METIEIQVFDITELEEKVIEKIVEKYQSSDAYSIDRQWLFDDFHTDGFYIYELIKEETGLSFNGGDIVTSETTWGSFKIEEIKEATFDKIEDLGLTKRQVAIFNFFAEQGFHLEQYVENFKSPTWGLLDGNAKEVMRDFERHNNFDFISFDSVNYETEADYLKARKELKTLDGEEITIEELQGTIDAIQESYTEAKELFIEHLTKEMDKIGTKEYLISLAEANEWKYLKDGTYFPVEKYTEKKDS